MALRGYNPFEDQSVLFQSFDEDFKSGDSASAVIDEHEKEQVITPMANLTTLTSPNDTFNNLTIGSYFVQGSEDVGTSLNYTNTDAFLEDSPSARQQTAQPKERYMHQLEVNEDQEGLPSSMLWNPVLPEMDESIPHSPPSFLQSLDSSELVSEMISPKRISNAAFQPLALESENTVSSPSKENMMLFAQAPGQPLPISTEALSTVNSGLALNDEDIISESFHDFVITPSIPQSSVYESLPIDVISSQGNISTLGTTTSRISSQGTTTNTSGLSSLSTRFSQDRKPNTISPETVCSLKATSTVLNESTPNAIPSEDFFTRTTDVIGCPVMSKPEVNSVTPSVKDFNSQPVLNDQSISQVSFFRPEDSTFNATSFNFTLTSINQMIEGGDDVDAVLGDILSRKKEKREEKKGIQGQPSESEMNVELQATKTNKSTRESNQATIVSELPRSTAASSGPLSYLGSSSQPLTISSSMRHELMNSSKLEASTMFDDTAGVSLLCDNNMTVQNSVLDFVASTPFINHQPDLGDLDTMRQSAIHCIVSPKRIVDILDLPLHVEVPEVCCVSLSQQVQFDMKNKLRWGVKCKFTMKKVAFNGNVMNDVICPFDVKQQMTLRPGSLETVQVLFTPNYAGDFCANMEVLAQNMTNADECRTYEVVITGRAEFPKLKVSPNCEEINFGDLMWGSNGHKRIAVQNVGQATLPIRFSVMRTNSTLCSFSFQSPDSLDVSRISLTNRPEAVANVISMSLPGVKNGEEVVPQAADLYCHIKDLENAVKSYHEPCEEFEGLLSIEVDIPIQRHRPLVQYRLRVRAGMIKLHLDKSELHLSSLPGQVKQGMVRVLNSGNISMKLTLRLEPPANSLSVQPDEMVLEPNGFQMATVSYKPTGYTDVSVNLVLTDQMCIHYLPVTGQTRSQSTKITASASYVVFEGVPVGEKLTKKFKFHLDQDVQVKCLIRGESQAFKLVTDQGIVQSSMEMNVIKGARYSVNIIFNPNEVKFYSSTLVLQVFRGDSFSIPLTGYGGVSCVKISGVTQASTGESVVLLGKVDSGSPITHRLSITNTGVRSAFIKAVINDMTRKVISPHHATIMPSQTLLAPNESQEMILMFAPNDTFNLASTSSERSLMAIVKLNYGDEIIRQLLIRDKGADCQRLALNYIVDLTPDQKALVDAEMSQIKIEKDAMHLFKASVKSKKIGLLGEFDKSPENVHHTISSAPTRQGSDVRCYPTSSPGPRPVLQALNFNVQSTKADKEFWSLSPSSISFKVLDAGSKEFAQIINYSGKDLRFSVETDSCLNVVPSRGTIAFKSWCRLEVMTSVGFWSEKNKPPCALIKVNCLDDTKYIRVLIEGVQTKMTFPPSFTSNNEVITTAQTSKSTEQIAKEGTQILLSSSLRGTRTSAVEGVQNSAADQVKSQRLASSCHRNPLPVTKGIQASEMVIMPPICPGERTEMMYAFTNVSKESLNWRLVPLKPLCHEIAETGLTESMETSVFRQRPQTGRLEAGDVQAVGLEFRPLIGGSYSQAWGIEYFGDGMTTSRHSFTIHAKANHKEPPVESKTLQSPTLDTSPRRLKPASQTAEVNSLPHWTTCPPQVDARMSTSSVTNTASSTSTTLKTKRPDSFGDNNADRLRPVDGRCLQLVEKTLRFKTLNIGNSETLFLFLKNTSPRDADITVEKEPRQPFIIRHNNFCVRKDRMTKVPVIFKPLHVAKFREQVVMRDKQTNVILTAILEAECAP